MALDDLNHLTEQILAHLCGSDGGIRCMELIGHKLYRVIQDRMFPTLGRQLILHVLDHYWANQETMTLEALKLDPEVKKYNPGEFLESIIQPSEFSSAAFRELMNNTVHSWSMQELRNRLQTTFLIAGGEYVDPQTKETLSGIQAANEYYLREQHNAEWNMHMGSDIVAPKKEDVFGEQTFSKMVFPFCSMERHRIKQHELITIAGNQKSGKTTLALLLSAYWCYFKHNILYFSLEMPASSIYRLYYLVFYNNLWGVPEKGGKLQFISQLKLDNNEYSEDELVEYRRAYDAIWDNYGTFRAIDSPNVTARYISQSAQRYRDQLSQDGKILDGIIVDYAGLMQADGAKRFISRSEMLNQVIIELKCLTLELKVPIITLYQFNRESQKRMDHSGIKIPRPYDLAYASEVERSSDKVMGLSVDFEDGNTREIIWHMMAARTGPSGPYVKYPFIMDMDTKVINEGVYTGEMIKSSEHDKELPLDAV